MITEHLDFLRRIVVMLGIAGGVWFIIVFLMFYVQERKRVSAQNRLRRRRLR